jgi:hypothetical protein
MRAGLDLPEELASGPEIRLGLQLYWRAFWDLSSCRNAQGVIPWRDIQYWCEASKLDDETTEEVHYHVKQMDSAFAELVSANKGSISGNVDSNDRRRVPGQNPGNNRPR